jgi:hypothetical protein
MDDLNQLLTSALPFISQILQAAALIGIATLIIVQVIKTPVRMAFHMHTTRHWFMRREPEVDKFRLFKFMDAGSHLHWLADAAFLSNPVEIPDYEPGEWRLFSRKAFSRLLSLMPFTATDFYLKNLQNVAQRAVEHPAGNGWIFAYFAADASLNDKVVAYQVDAAVQRDPKLIEKLTIRDEDYGERGLAAAIASAQDNVSAAIDRGLDDLQIRLMFWWPILIRLAALAIAIGLSLWFISMGESPLARGRLLLLCALIGFAAAYIASFIYDVLGLLASFRPSR